MLSIDVEIDIIYLQNIVIALANEKKSYFIDNEILTIMFTDFIFG